ncbi:hypothetical protein CRENBAI_010024, partial [Crenichthys baileyi]
GLLASNQYMSKVFQNNKIEIQEKYIDRTAAMQEDRKRQAGKEQGKQTERQAGLGGLKSRLGCGLVGCHGWGAGGVEVSILVNESSQGTYSFEFPCGTTAAGGRKNPLHRQGERA